MPSKRFLKKCCTSYIKSAKRQHAYSRSYRVNQGLALSSPALAGFAAPTRRKLILSATAACQELGVEIPIGRFRD